MDNQCEQCSFKQQNSAFVLCNAKNDDCVAAKMQRQLSCYWLHKEWWLWTNRVLILCSQACFLIFMVMFSVWNSHQLAFNFNVEDNADLENVHIFMIGITAFGLALTTLYSVSCWLAKPDQLKTYYFQFIFLAFLSGAWANLVVNAITYAVIYSTGKVDENFYSKKRILVALGIRKWLTLDYVMVAMFVGLAIAFSYIEENLLPTMPNGGGIGIKYIPLIIFAFLHSFIGGWMVGAISALVMLGITPSGHIVSAWSYLLDYFLPMTTPSLAGLIRFKVTKDRNYVTYMNYFIMCFLIMLIIYIWQVLVGVIVWNVMFPDSVWNGYGGWIYSIIYNFIHVFLFTYPIVQVVTPLVLRVLAPVYTERFSSRYYHGY